MVNRPFPWSVLGKVNFSGEMFQILKLQVVEFMMIHFQSSR